MMLLLTLLMGNKSINLEALNRAQLSPDLAALILQRLINTRSYTKEARRCLECTLTHIHITQRAERISLCC